MLAFRWFVRILSLFLPLAPYAQAAGNKDASPKALVYLQVKKDLYQFQVKGRHLKSRAECEGDNRVKLTGNLWYPELRNQVDQAKGWSQLVGGDFRRVRLQLPKDWRLELTSESLLTLLPGSASDKPESKAKEPTRENTPTESPPCFDMTDKEGFEADKEYKLEFDGRKLRAQVTVCEDAYPQTGNPIRLENKSLATQGTLRYRIDSDFAQAEGVTAAVLIYQYGEVSGPRAVVPMEISPVPGEPYHAGTAVLPKLGLDSPPLLGTAITLKTVAIVSYKDDYAVRTDKVKIHVRWKVALWSLLAILSILFVAHRIASKVRAVAKNPAVEKEPAAEKTDQGKERSPGQKLFGFLGLGFAETASGKYSVSLLQATFWTLVTVWGLIFVWLIQGELIEITAQVLILLGIGGGTAIVTRSIAGGREIRIPTEFTPSLDRSPRIPKVSDLMTIVGKPSLFKFQILSVTSVVGVIVVREIFCNGSFPVLDENLLLLMGISGSSYVLNEATEKDSQKLAELVKELKQMDKAARAQPEGTAKIAELEELAEKLRGWERTSST